MSQSEAEEGGERGGGRGERQKDLLTFSELRFSSEEKKKRGPPQPTELALNYTIRNAPPPCACGRLLIVCQQKKKKKKKMPVRAQVQLCKVGVRDTVTKAAKGVSKKRAAHVQASGSQVRR